ncbi:helix-turn-helix domain-containing protein [Microbacterium sp. 22296]
MLNDGTDPRAPSFPLLQTAFEHLASAVVSELAPDDAPQGAGSAARRLKARAERVMYDRAHDPDFTVAELTGILGVSHSYLARVYSASGTTAHRRLGEIRMGRAIELLRVDRDDPATVAARSGFSSTRALRRALRASPLADGIRTEQSSRRA